MRTQSESIEAPIAHLRSALALVVFGLLGLAVWAPAAEAEPPDAPLLFGTNPESPGLSTTPRIVGHIGGIGTSVLGPRLSTTKVGTRTLDPASTVRIYADAACSGPVTATGPLSEFETSGIEVVVAAGSTTEFAATVEDPAQPGEVSHCSSPLTYRQVSVAPQPPTLTAVNPESPADDNFPHVLGEVEAEATVDLFDNPECSGAPLASGLATELVGSGIEVHVADNSVTHLYGTASWAGLTSACSPTFVAYEESTKAPPPPPPAEAPQPISAEVPKVGDHAPAAYDPPGKPPAPKLRVAPVGPANDNTPLVSGRAPNANTVELYTTAGCSGDALVGGSAAQFTGAGLTITVKDNSTTTFYGVSVDGGGDRSPCSQDPVTYTEDSTLPQIMITGGPGATTKRRSAVFTFVDTSEDTTDAFFCRLDKKSWKPCQAPYKVKRLGFRRHTVRVKAVDAAGNTEAKPALRRFRVVH